MRKKIVYYSDQLTDDFAEHQIKQKPLDKNFKYVNKCPVWNFFAWIFYYFLAIPVGLFFCVIRFRSYFRNRKVLRKCKRKGFFLYANHTQGVADAFLPALNVFPKRNFILVNKDAVSIRGIKQLVLMLGAIPVATSLTNIKGMNACIKKRIANKHVVTIYPEATIWPFHTQIREFKASSFRYPVELDAPVYAQTTTYRKRRGISRLWTSRPFITTYIDGPFYPDKTLSTKAAMQKLRDEVFEAMTKRAQTKKNFAYIKYLPKENKTEK